MLSDIFRGASPVTGCFHMGKFDRMTLAADQKEVLMKMI